MKNSQKDKREFVAKILIIGETSVGKTSILNRYTEGQFTDNIMPTLGIDYRIKKIKKTNQDIKMQIWDTAGQERFRSITQNFYKGAMGILLAFDLTDQKTFQQLRNWILSIQQHSGPEVCKVILANKQDDTTNIEVTDEDIKNMEEEQQIKVIKTSAKTGSGIEEAFNYISDLVEQTHLLKQENTNTQNSPSKKNNLQYSLYAQSQKQTKEKSCC